MKSNTGRTLVFLHSCLLASSTLAHITDFYRNRRVVVTGGCGFIGSHLVEQLVAHEAYVTVIDDCSTGSEDNLIHLQDKIRFIKKSMADASACQEAVQGAEIVFHLAAFISVPLSLAYPSKCHASNVEGTATILEAAYRAGVSRFIFSSSAAVYGVREERCYEASLCTPTSPYGYSKWIGELLCQQYTRCFGLPTLCLRYFNVYGPRQNGNGAYAAVVAKFQDLMSKNQAITIFGDGLQTRDFISVDKVVEANLLVATLDARYFDGQPCNIATGISINLLELIDALKKEFPDYTGEVIFAPARPGDIAHSQADCSRYAELRAHAALTVPDATLKNQNRIHLN